MSNASEMTMVQVLREGETIRVPFMELRCGDQFPKKGITVANHAHHSGDASHDGWLFYDTTGEGWFPEDFVTSDSQVEDILRDCFGCENTQSGDAYRRLTQAIADVGVVTGLKECADRLIVALDKING